MADDFAEVKRAYQEFKQKSANQDRQLKHAQQQRTVLKERLDTLSSRRTDLDNQEKKLQQADAQFVDQIKNLQSAQARRSGQENALKQQLVKAKISRNQAWVQWIFEKYSQFDQMTLIELQNWFDSAMKKDRGHDNVDTDREKPVQHRVLGDSQSRNIQQALAPKKRSSDSDSSDSNSGSNSGSSGGSSGGSGGKSQYLKVQDEQRRIVNEQHETKMKTLDQATRVNHQDQRDDEPTMPLSKKQRIFINQDENNPIDTMGEAIDAEQLESPLGNRDAEDDADKYLSRQAKAQEKAHEKYSRDMDEFEL